MLKAVKERGGFTASAWYPTLIAVSLLLGASGLTAQGHSVTLRGIVFDSATGLGIPDVAIHVNQSLLPERTDSLGDFLLRGMGIGEYSLTLAKPGYAPEVLWLNVTTNQGDTVDIGGLPLPPLTEAITGAVSGTVLDSRSNVPVVESSIFVNGTLAAFSGDSGGFTTGVVDIVPGLNVIEFKRIGYEPYEARVWAVRQHTDFDVDVTLDPMAVSFDTLTVEGDREALATGAMREFYQRRRTRIGHFVTRQDIDEQRPVLTSDMLRMAPGIMVRPGVAGGSRIETFGPRGSCSTPTIFVDGHFVATETAEDFDALIHPDEVAGIEVYARPAQVPGRFKITGAVCGVIAVWTKHR